MGCADTAAHLLSFLYLTIKWLREEQKTERRKWKGKDEGKKREKKKKKKKKGRKKRTEKNPESEGKRKKDRRKIGSVAIIRKMAGATTRGLCRLTAISLSKVTRCMHLAWPHLFGDLGDSRVSPAQEQDGAAGKTVAGGAARDLPAGR